MNATSSDSSNDTEIAPISDTDPAALQLQALRLLAVRPELSQRQLSRELGLSVGKTHYVLHALLDKGLVKVRNFRSSNNKMAYAYLLTAHGLREKIRLTQAFLIRKESEFEAMQATLSQLRLEVMEAPASIAGAVPRGDSGS